MSFRFIEKLSYVFLRAVFLEAQVYSAVMKVTFFSRVRSNMHKGEHGPWSKILTPPLLAL